MDKAFPQEQLYSVVRQIQDAGISVIGNYIFGLPEDDRESMRATLDLALDLKCEFANFYSAMAYPGSPLYTLASKMGVPLPQRWTGYSQHSRDCLPMPTRYLPAHEVLRFRDAAFQEYYTDAGVLGMMERRFGMKSVEDIRRMTSHTLDRDLLSGALAVSPTLLPPDDAAVPAPVPQLQQLTTR